MPCKYCRIKPVIQLISSDIKLCEVCFSRYFEKKFYKTIRTYNMIGESKSIFIEKDRFSELNSYLLNKLSKERRDKFKVIKKKIKESKIVKSDNLDKTSNLILSSEVNNKLRKDLTPTYKNEIKPLYFISDEEILLYCKIKKIKVKETKQDKVDNFIEEVEKRYSGTKNNIVKSYLDLVKALD